jgi:hypothetical protein
VSNKEDPKGGRESSAGQEFGSIAEIEEEGLPERERAFVKRLRDLGGSRILWEFENIGWPLWLLLQIFRNRSVSRSQEQETRKTSAATRKLFHQTAEGLRECNRRDLRTETGIGFVLPGLLGTANDLDQAVDLLRPPANAPRKDRVRALRLVFAWTTRRNTRRSDKPKGDPHDRLGFILYRAVLGVDLGLQGEQLDRALKNYRRRRQEDEVKDSPLLRTPTS